MNNLLYIALVVLLVLLMSVGPDSDLKVPIFVGILFTVAVIATRLLNEAMQRTLPVATLTGRVSAVTVDSFGNLNLNIGNKPAFIGEAGVRLQDGDVIEAAGVDGSYFNVLAFRKQNGDVLWSATPRLVMLDNQRRIGMILGVALAPFVIGIVFLWMIINAHRKFMPRNNAIPEAKRLLASPSSFNPF